MIYDLDNFPELPETWVSACVNDVFTQVSTSNKQIKSKEALVEGRFPVIDQGAQFVSGYCNDEEKCISASIEQPIYLFGDHTRTLKKITTLFVPGADGTKLLQATSVFNSDYAFSMLRAIKLPDRGYSRHFQFLRDAQIPLAPLPEQKRIADKLDATLARVDACRARLARVAPILKRFRQSVLAAATSGQLTVDWREQQGHGHAGNDGKTLQGNADASNVGRADEGNPTLAAHNERWASQVQPNLRADSASGSSDPCATEVLSGTQVHQQIQFVDVREPYSHRVTAPLSWVKSTIGEMVDIIGGSQPPKSVFQTSPGEGLIRLIQIRDYKSDKHLTYIPVSLAKRFCSETDVMIGRYGPPIFQILRGLEGLIMLHS
ncbi:hypothetical protein ACFSQE_12925 [Vogesella fluminis]|uniref:hypothetical protein n=1 Tax=Vogesella fluminis TaxID=1069161 RepID=UPI00364204C6